MNKRAARRLAIATERARWERFDAEVARKRAIPQTAEEIEQSRAYLRKLLG